MQSAAAISFILDKLSHELNSSLSYHNLSHTERVIQHVSVIAEEEGVIAVRAAGVIREISSIPAVRRSQTKA